MLKSHFREAFRAFQTGQLAELVRKNMFVLSLKDGLETTETKPAGCWKRNKEMTIYMVSLPRDK